MSFLFLYKIERHTVVFLGGKPWGIQLLNFIHRPPGGVYSKKSQKKKKSTFFFVFFFLYRAHIYAYISYTYIDI